MAKTKAVNPRGFDCVNVLLQKAVKKVLVMARKRQQAIDWSKKNRVQKRAANKAYAQRHHKKTLKMSEDWRQANKERVRANENALNKKKVKDNDMAFILKKRMRARLQQFMLQRNLRKVNNTFNMIGMNKNQLVDHLQKQLLGDETLKDSDVDHIFPLDMYNLSTGIVDPRCMHFSNLQPLPPFENGSKLNKLPTKAMADKVDPSCWPDGITRDMLPDEYPGWSTALRM